MPPVRINVVKGHEGCGESQWAVVGADTGKVHGCHATQAEARRQQAAIYASVNRQNMPQSLKEEIERRASLDSDRILERLIALTDPDWQRLLDWISGSHPTDESGNISPMSAVAEADAPVEEVEDPNEVEVEALLGTIGYPTSDGRYLAPDEISHRELPWEIHMQPAIAEGHEGALPVGRMEQISYIPFSKFGKKEQFYAPDQIKAMEEAPHDPTVVFGQGVLNGPNAVEAKRRIENGAGASIDGLHRTGDLFDSTSFEKVDTTDLGLGDLLEGVAGGQYLQGLAGKIGGLTIVAIGAFEEARVGLTASAGTVVIRLASWGALAPSGPRGLVAAAGPLKPPKAWFENPGLKELTPITITKDGQVFGHLADWQGCHTGFRAMCNPPYRSASNYAYFNVAELETEEGDMVTCGKLMFSRDGVGHAPVDRPIEIEAVRLHYDDATQVGAHVHAGEDKFGIWLAGALRPGLNDLEVQHLRSHPPSGDWRPVKGQMELVCAFSVAIPGFPIRRALVASAGDELAGMISAPLEIKEHLSPRERRLKYVILDRRLREVLGMDKTRQELLDETYNRLKYGPWDDSLQITQAVRERAAKAGHAMPDGSYPILTCTGGPGEPAADNAIRGRGRGGHSPQRQAQIDAHIRSQVRRLGCKGPIFDNFMKGD